MHTGIEQAAIAAECLKVSPGFLIFFENADFFIVLRQDGGAHQTSQATADNDEIESLICVHVKMILVY